MRSIESTSILCPFLVFYFNIVCIPLLSQILECHLEPFPSRVFKLKRLQGSLFPLVATSMLLCVIPDYFVLFHINIGNSIGCQKSLGSFKLYMYTVQVQISVTT